MALVWSENALPSTSSTLTIFDCCWAPGIGGGLFVAVGFRTAGVNRIMTSPDGVTWTLRNAPESNSYQGVAYSPTAGAASTPLLVAVAATGTNRVATSPDGINWTAQSASSAKTWNAVSWSDAFGLFVAASQDNSTVTGVFMSSPDGITWTARDASTGGTGGKTWLGVANNPAGPRFAVVSSSSAPHSVNYSTNGTAFNDSNITPVNAAFGGATIVGNKARGTNAISWSSTLSKFAAINTSGGVNVVYTSSDTTGAWTATTMPSGGTDGTTWNAIVANSTGFLIAADNTQESSKVKCLATTIDGATWTTIDPGFYRNWHAFCFSSTLGTYVGFPETASDTVLTGQVLTPSLSPATGTAGGGNTLTINGDQSNGGFVAGLKVFMDPYILATLGTVTPASDRLNVSGIFTEASNVTIVNTHQLTCTVPPGIGVSDVMVLNANAASPNIAAWFPAGYTFINPALVSINPTHGPGIGDTLCTITGTNLFPYGGPSNSQSQSIRFGSDLYAYDAIVVNATTITCTAPAHVVADPDIVDVTLFASVHNQGSPFASTNPAIIYPASTLTAAYTYDPLWWEFEWPDLDDFPEFEFELPGFDIPDYPVFIYDIDPPECPLLFLLHWGIISPKFYNAFVDPDDACQLNLHSGSFPIPRLGAAPPWGWTPYTTPPTDRGWWLSIGDEFGGASVIVSNSIPKDSRTFREIADFAKGSATMLGGFPGTMASLDNHLIYAPGGYAVGTDVPTLRIFDGSFDREIGFIPKTATGGVPKSIMTTLVADGTLYFSTLDSGTLSADYVGRVFSLSLETGVFTIIGSAFPAGHVPYALAFHMGRLWCGTNCRDPLVPGRVYFFRPGVDTSWVLDTTLTTGGVTSLLPFNGLLYVGTSAPAGTFAPIRVRSALGVYTSSDTGTGGTARENNCYPALATYNSKLYASYWNPDTPNVSKVRVFDGTTWSTSYTGAGATLLPYIAFPQDGSTLLALGGGVGYSAALVGTTDGVNWTDRSAFLTQGSPASTGVPAFGVVVR